MRWKEAQAEEARAREAARQEELERELLRLHCEVKKLKLEHELWCFEQKYSPTQPRDELGRWTRIGGGESNASADGGDAAATETQNESGSDGVVLSDAKPDPIRAGDRFANVIPICMLGSHGISTDRFGNQVWRAEYICADGFTFPGFGNGGRIPGFAVDPRR